MRHSRSLDRTGRLEIGRCKLASVVLRPGFFITEVMSASLKVAGKVAAVVRPQLFADIYIKYRR